MGSLTTHILDTMHGCPAAQVTIRLLRVETEASGDQRPTRRTLLKTVQTNAEGRTDAPLLAGDEFVVGVYELHFAIGAYFKRQLVVTPQPPFLDIVPISFGIADPTAHYHIPLLVSPWAYSTYRGS
jgi:5-hydroxyisourate hydrolase